MPDPPDVCVHSLHPSFAADAGVSRFGPRSLRCGLRAASRGASSCHVQWPVEAAREERQTRRHEQVIRCFGGWIARAHMRVLAARVFRVVTARGHGDYCDSFTTTTTPVHEESVAGFCLGIGGFDRKHAATASETRWALTTQQFLRCATNAW